MSKSRCFLAKCLKYSFLDVAEYIYKQDKDTQQQYDSILALFDLKKNTNVY